MGARRLLVTHVQVFVVRRSQILATSKASRRSSLFRTEETRCVICVQVRFPDRRFEERRRRRIVGTPGFNGYGPARRFRRQGPREMKRVNGLKQERRVEDTMLVTDLIHSCSNEMVAQAALMSIGGRFAERVRVTAQEKGVSVGRFVAAVVRDFAQRADDSVREALRERILGDDQPLLTGLRALIEPALGDGAVSFDEELVAARAMSVGQSCAGALRYQ
jgi:hypothetical protein